MTEPIANKIGVANLGPVYSQINNVTIHEARKVALIYSDPLPDLRVFQGREPERSKLNTWLADRSVSMIGIRGEGGIGKSTLMAKVFAESQGFEGKFWVDVRTGTSITELIERAFQELGVPPEQTNDLTKNPEKKDLMPRLLRHLQQGRYLLAIDNLESVLTATGDWQSGYETFFDSFQSLGSKCVLLLGSREYPPKYFGWRQSRWLMVERGLEPAEGAALLAALEVEDTDEQREAVSVQVQGNPLALALIAGWLRNRPGERTITHLQQHTNLFQLTGKHRGESLSMERVLQWSIDRLTPENQHLLMEVSFLREAFDSTTAAMRASATSISDTDLDDLERRSLLQALPERNKGQSKRFRLQPRIQEFLQKRKIDLIQQSLETARKNGDRGGEANSLNSLGSVYGSLEQYQQAIDLYQQSLKIRREIVDRGGEAFSLNNLGNAYNSLEQYQQAIEYYQQSLKIRREIVDRGGEAFSLNNLGNAYNSLEQYQQAIEYYQQSLEIKREIGDHRNDAILLGRLGNAYSSSGQLQQAIECYQQALEIVREIGDRRGEVDLLGSLGSAYMGHLDFRKAVDCLEQTLEIARKIGYRRSEAIALEELPGPYGWLKEYQRMIDCYQQLLEIKREIGDRRGEVISLDKLASAYMWLGEDQRAIECHQQASKIAHEIGDRQFEEISLARMGLALVDIGKRSRRYEALQRFQQALAIFEELKHEYMVKECKTAIAENQIMAARQRWQTLGLWFAVGLAIALLIWWLR